MPITPYALNVKGVDFGQSVNALNTVRQMQAANQQRELNALAMQKAQSEMADAQALKNALSQYDINTSEGQNALMRTPGGLPLVSAFQKNVVAQQKAKSEGLKTDLELFSKAAGFMPDTAENYKYLYEGATKDNPALSNLLPHWNQYKPGMMQEIGVGSEAIYRRKTQEDANAARLAAAERTAGATKYAADVRAGAPVVLPEGSSLVGRGGEVLIQGKPKSTKASWQTVTDESGNVTSFNPDTGETKKFGQIGKPEKGTWINVTDDKGNVSIINPATGETRKIEGAGKTNIGPQSIQLEREKFSEQQKQNLFKQNFALRNQKFDEWKNDPQTQQAAAQAVAYGKALGENAVMYQQQMPNVIQQAELGVDLIDKMIGKQTFDEKGNVKSTGTPHKGFDWAVGAGIGLRFVPGTDEADFQAMYDQVKGQAFLQAFNTLKGGGSITETEGTKATNAITRMSLSTSEKEFVEAARELQGILRKGIQRANSNLQGAVAPSGRGFAPSGEKDPNAVDTSNPLL